MSLTDKDWAEQFRIATTVDLDFVIGQSAGLPIGLLRESAPEFKRKVLASAISYHLDLASVDYTLKRYVPEDAYEDEALSLGDETSEFILDSAERLMHGLKDLHTQTGLSFGIFGAEITLFKVPDLIISAKILANRGFLLEVIPLLRMTLEMIAWSSVAFHTEDETAVRALKAQACMGKMKNIYGSVGKVYGYLSKFSHWEHVIHSTFVETIGEGAAVIRASARHRAVALTLCLIILDMLIEVARSLYGHACDSFILEIQGTRVRDANRATHQLATRISNFSECEDIRTITGFLC